jgi:hypothetical protein
MDTTNYKKVLILNVNRFSRLFVYSFFSIMNLLKTNCVFCLAFFTKLNVSFCCIFLLLFVFCSKFEINIEHQRMEIMLLMYEDVTSVSQGSDRNFKKKNHTRISRKKESGKNSRTQESCLEGQFLPRQPRFGLNGSC